MRLTDAEGRIILVNPAFCQMVGMRAEDLEGQWYTVVLPEARRAHNLSAYRARMRNGQIESRLERELELWDGRSIWVEVSNSIVESPRGPAVLSLFRDVSQRKMAEADLRVALEKAESANRSKTEFLANVSHEIRTPLNGVIGMTELGLDGKLSPETREYLETALSSARGLLALLNDLLDLSKIEAGRLAIESITVDPRELVAEVLQALQVSAERKGLRMEVNIGPGVPRRIKTDPLRLRQVLLNLVGNAIKFTSKGRIRITIDGVPQSGQVLKLEGAIEDSGIGIAPADLRRVFEPFEQADGSTSRRFGGSGLGLPICRRLLRLMGGDVWAESELGHGSIFRFELTAGLVEVGAAPLTAAAARAIEAWAPADGAEAQKPLSILVAEDNPVNQRVVLRTLEREGHKVSLALNGREALSLLESKRFDLILMDVQMPDMDGLEATTRIRQSEMGTGRHIPIIALTAHSMPTDQVRCEAAGMDAYVAKPFERTQLSRVVAHYGSLSGMRQPVPASALQGGGMR